MRRVWENKNGKNKVAFVEEKKVYRTLLFREV